MNSPKTFDVVVIGGGPGGYVAAIRAAQLGKSVAIVEKEALGGICLNWGCIPTKTLLRNAEVLHLVKQAHKYGINISDYTFDFKATIRRSREVSRRFSKGIEYLMEKNSITHLHGIGRLKSSREVEVTDKQGKKSVLGAGFIIIATGGRNQGIPGSQVDRRRVISFREALTLDAPPKRMIIVGAGAIGVEFAGFYHEYGTEIHLVEMLANVLPTEDEEISRALAAIYRKRGINIHVSTVVEKIESLRTKVKVHVKSGEESRMLDGDVALVAIGIRGNVEDLGLEEVGVEVKNGWIKVNEFYETSVTGVYAIGDVIGPPWLAHVASAEGRVAAEHLSDKQPRSIDYENIPFCTYCRPQVASIGLTEKAALEAGRKIKVGRFPLRASGKAVAIGESSGFVKIIFDAEYGELLGCHIMGPHATELIAEVAVARTLATTHEEIIRTVHAHPTIAEAIMEAAADAYGVAIHI